MPTENTETTPSPSWDYNGVTYPLFAYDQPAIVKLPNGTEHAFRLWDEVTEKKREDLLKTVVITSPHLLNGEAPRDIKTDFTRSQIAYYSMMIDKVRGVNNLGSDVTDWTDANATTGEFLETTTKGGQPIEARIQDYIGAPIKKAAASRLYGGKIELEKPDPEETEDDIDADPFSDEEASDIQEKLDKAEAQKELYKLTLNRIHIISQKLGIETVQGRESAPTNWMRYHFREPSGDEFSVWELKGYRGFSVSLAKGGEKSERYYNLETVKRLFNRLIERIEGASIGGMPVELPSDRNDPTRIALLEKVPLSIKKLTVATLFAEMANLGNF